MQLTLSWPAWERKAAARIRVSLASKPVMVEATASAAAVPGAPAASFFGGIADGLRSSGRVIISYQRLGRQVRKRRRKLGRVRIEAGEVEGKKVLQEVEFLSASESRDYSR